MSAARDPTARLRAGLNPLLTASLGVYHNQNNTPISALSMASHNPFSPVQTPASAIQPYNPQEWVASPVATSERGHQFHEPQASPPPPPPYSPQRNQRPTSLTIDAQAARDAVSRNHPSTSSQRITSPEAPSATTTFAPPPGASGRGASRERRFGLPSFGRRRDTDQSNASSDLSSTQSPIHPHTITSRHQPQIAPLRLQIPERNDSQSSQNAPPGARRAVSTPAIATPTSARSRSSSQVRWNAGVPIPPPPPGPPPSASRSQSVNPSSGSDPVVSPPTRRPPPSGVAALGPVPPTPSDWVDSDSGQRSSSPNRTSLASEDTSVCSSAGQADSLASVPSSAGGLARARAVRGEKTLRERRNESRTRGVSDSIDAALDTPELSDIVIPPTGGLTRRLTINRSTPRTPRSLGGTPQAVETASKSYIGHDSREPTPRKVSSPNDPSSEAGTPTPPFSPHPQKAQPMPDNQIHMAPKALPTPPTQSRSSSGSTRPALECVVPAPLSPAKRVTKEEVVNQTADQFSWDAIERFKRFAQKESAATDDAARVRLFAEFFVRESRVRRERYSGAIGAMGSEILDLTRDLFRPMAPAPDSAVSVASPAMFTPQSSATRSNRGSMNSSQLRETPVTSSAPSSGSLPMSPVGPSPGTGNWPSSNYMPSLSPILSMSVGDAYDEEDSRGRPASRWWEAESVGNSSTRLERSKRESKYMGVPKEAREALQWIDGNEAGPSRPVSSTEYPPEKVGWHEDQASTPQQRAFRNSALSVSTPYTPSQNHLDISRLVTLPPPYPRHHPAVNNNHPELTQTRTTVRGLSDMTEVDATKDRFLQSSAKRRADAAESAKQREKALRTNLQQEIGSGNINYGEAAAIEADAKSEATARAKELEKADFEVFQTAVVAPLNELLTERIGRATQLFDELRGRLFVETRSGDPNGPQEEGDEQPELLEKLTLLKWIFEAREALHRAIYDLLSDRNDRYRDMVLTPYRLSGNAEKVASATEFFAEDAGKRARAAADEALQRTQEFRDVVEQTVARGVEAQLGAFWDIAPPLRRLLDGIPVASDLSGFAVKIPPREYEENPAYVGHPLQYLFSLLLHAEKSTFQFIESQTNLLCLLHEVREAGVTAKGRVLECDGRAGADVERMRRDETARLTDDLKGKVRVVHEQWDSALGQSFGVVKEKVGGYLLETGGWDESLEDGGVGEVQV